MPNAAIDLEIDKIVAVIDAPDTPQGVVDWLTDIAQNLHRAADNDIPEHFLKGAQLPSSIGELADAYAIVREARLAKDKDAARIKDRETEIYKVIMSILDESTDTGASGQTHRVQRVMKTVTNTEDWPTFHAFIQQSGAFELLQKRLSSKAVEDWVEVQGNLPPGLKSAEIATLSFSKV